MTARGEEKRVCPGDTGGVVVLEAEAEDGCGRQGQVLLPAAGCVPLGR